MAKTNLYRFFDAEGNLLYIGVSLSVIKRVQEHMQEKHWMPESGNLTWTTYETREAAEAAERNAIRVEKPKHNVTYNQIKHNFVRREIAVSPLSPSDLALDCVRDGDEISHYKHCSMRPGGSRKCRFEKGVIAWHFCCKRAWLKRIWKFGYRKTMNELLPLYLQAQKTSNELMIALDGNYPSEPPQRCNIHRIA